jgi:hypothetical protein
MGGSKYLLINHTQNAAFLTHLPCKLGVVKVEEVEFTNLGVKIILKCGERSDLVAYCDKTRRGFVYVTSHPFVSVTRVRKAQDASNQK